MRPGLMLSTVLAAVSVMLGAGGVMGQDKSKPGSATAQPGAPDMQAMMQKMMELATPGAPHQLLAKMAGKWSITTRMWTGGPVAPPTESKGTAEMAMILGGRFLSQEVRGDFNGMPFEGTGLYGYDNAQKKYISFWIDNMGTMMMTGLGTADSAGKVITYVSIYDDPMTGEKNKKIRQVLRFVSDDQIAFEMYDSQQGKEFKSFDMTYNRVK